MSVFTIKTDYLKELRDVGVKSFKTNSDETWSVEFFEPIPEIESGAIIPQKLLTQNAPFMEDKCACDHDKSAHDGHGLCLLGCEVEKCARGKGSP